MMQYVCLQKVLRVWYSPNPSLIFYKRVACVNEFLTIKILCHTNSLSLIIVIIQISFHLFKPVNIIIVQVDGPSYELVLKKEKAHDMDVNAVKWNPTVFLLNG